MFIRVRTLDHLALRTIHHIAVHKPPASVDRTIIKDSFLKPAGFHSDHPDPCVKVESGFLNLYTASEKNCRFAKSSAQEQIHAEVKRLVEMYKGEKLSITITGHSLGSALAMLSAYDITEMGINEEKENENEKIPIIFFSFAGPRVGNSAFKERLEQLGSKSYQWLMPMTRFQKFPTFAVKFSRWRQTIPVGLPTKIVYQLKPHRGLSLYDRRKLNTRQKAPMYVTL